MPVGHIRYDNLRSAVSRVLWGRNRTESEHWIAFRSHYGFDAFYCMPGIDGAHEKGGVEGEIGRFRRAHLSPVPTVESLTELNERVEQIDATEDARRITGRARTIGQDFAVEQPLLGPLPVEVFEPGQWLTPRVDRFARITVRCYSVPAEATHRIIELCARLPLALGIAAARIQTRPTVPLTVIADELDDRTERLDLLATEDADTGLRPAFSWSYTALTDPAAHAFRLLGLHPGPDLSATAIASLCGYPRAAARRVIDELTRTNLVTEHLPQRYRLHSLLRDYATELVQTTETADDRSAATHRLLDHYLHSAYAADRAIETHRDPIPLPAPAESVYPDQPNDLASALAWFDTEQENLTALLLLAARQHLDTHTWRIAWTCSVYFYRTSRGPIWINIQNEVIEACRRLGDKKAEALVTLFVAELTSDLGRYEEAIRLAHHGRAIMQELGDRIGVASANLLIAYTRLAQGKLTETIRRNLDALETYQAFGRKANQAGVFCNLSRAYAQNGGHQRSISYAQEALTLAVQTGDPESIGNASRALGYANLRNGKHEQAVESYRQAMEMYRAIGDRRREALARTGLGNANQVAGQEQQARTDWHKALDIFKEINHPNAIAIAIQTKLANNNQDHTFTPSGHDPNSSNQQNRSGPASGTNGGLDRRARRGAAWGTLVSDET